MWLRAGLFYLAALNAGVGIWATMAPRSFYDDFPGTGHAWVSGDGPYNEHLVRDVGAASLGMLVVVLAAAWLLSRSAVVVAGASMTVATLPHAIHHSRHSESFASVGDKVASIGSLWVGVGVAVALAVAASGLGARN